MNEVKIKHEGEEYLIDSATLEKCKVIKPTWDRMEVLRGEWIPPKGTPYYPISKDSRHINMAWGNQSKDGKVCSKDDVRGDAAFPDYYFFPTRELAEEYFTIAEGKWLPMGGDRIFSVFKNDLSTMTFNGIMGDSPNENLLTSFIYFPSERQRDEYIPKHKKQERPLVGKEAIIDGVTYKLQ